MRRTLFEDASGAFPANVHRNEVAVLRPLGGVSPACDEVMPEASPGSSWSNFGSRPVVSV